MSFADDLPGFCTTGEYFGSAKQENRLRLTASDPTSIERQRDIAVSYSKLATLAEKANDPQANEWWRKCLAVFDRMIAAGLHVSPGDMRFVEQVRAKLGGAPGAASGWKKPK